MPAANRRARAAAAEDPLTCTMGPRPSLAPRRDRPQQIVVRGRIEEGFAAPHAARQRRRAGLVERFEERGHVERAPPRPGDGDAPDGGGMSPSRCVERGGGMVTLGLGTGIVRCACNGFQVVAFCSRGLGIMDPPRSDPASQSQCWLAKAKRNFCANIAIASKKHVIV